MGYFSDGTPRQEIRIEAHKDTLIYKEYKDKLTWIAPKYGHKYTTITLEKIG